MPYFSVVVPIYNVEKYLQECIESILGQDFSDFEMILVDDGSIDESGKICDKYAQKDARIKVIHKNNKGPSSARNAGIEAAQGEWLVFIDSDDFFNDVSFLGKLYQKAQETSAKVITYGVCVLINESKKVIATRYDNTDKINNLLSETEKISYLVERDEFSISAWLHACNTAFIKQNELYFDENLKTGEDLEWTPRMLLSKPKMVGLAGAPYTYRIRENSICTSKKKSGFWKMRYAALEKTMQLLHKSIWSEEEKTPIYQYLAYTYYILLGAICDEPNEEVRKEAFHEIKKFNGLQKYHAGRKVNLSRAVVRLFGVSCGAKILNCYMHIHAGKKQPIEKR